MGVTTMATPRTTLAANFAGLAVTPLAHRHRDGGGGAAATGRDRRHRRSRTRAARAAVSRRADELASCDSNSEIFQLARALPAGRGRRHRRRPHPRGVAHRVAGIPIIEAYANGRAFGRIDLAVDRTRGAVVEATLFPPQGVRRRRKLRGGAGRRPTARSPRRSQPALVAGRAAKRGRAPRRRCARRRSRAPTRRESAFGNLVADLMRPAPPGGDVAITNGGGLRADLPKAAALTYGSLFEALPFDNTLRDAHHHGRPAGHAGRQQPGTRRGHPVDLGRARPGTLRGPIAGGHPDPGKRTSRQTDGAADAGHQQLPGDRRRRGAARDRRGTARLGRHAGSSGTRWRTSCGRARPRSTRPSSTIRSRPRLTYPGPRPSAAACSRSEHSRATISRLSIYRLGSGNSAPDGRATPA